MQIETLLSRPGLAPTTRLLVAASVAVWHAHWSELRACAELARTRGQPRTDFEEILLQAILFCGFPRVVTAFEQFGEAWPTSEPPRGGAVPPADRRQQGSELFAAVYGKNEESVRRMLVGYHAELHDFVIDAAYGRILSRPAIDAKTREVVAVGVLAAQQQLRQFVGHARGAMHLGPRRTSCAKPC